MSDPRDHHFIPAFYLKNWAGSDGKLIEHAVRRGRIISKRVGPRATGFERDLYAFPDLSKADAQFLERIYFDYADRVADAALKIQITDPTVGWTTDLVTAWSRFILGIHLRHPDSMPELRAGAAAVLDTSGVEFQAGYESIRKPTDPATFEEYIAAKDPLTKIKMQVNLIVKALDNEFICSNMNQMIWGVVDLSGAGIEFLVSDRPVEIYSLSQPKGFITLPLTPTKLFVAANDPLTLPMLHKPNREVIERVNLALVSRARRYVWARDDSQRAFIENHMSTQLEPSPFFPHLKFTIRADFQPSEHRKKEAAG
jgi:hypothetical protein